MTIVYSRPQCVQCDATVRYLESKGKAYQKIDVMQDDSALEKIKGLGYLQAPVVVTAEQHWSGFRPDLLDKYAA